MTDPQYDEEVWEACEIAARSLSSQYGPFAPYEDALQDAYVWVLEHPERVQHAYMADGAFYTPQMVAEILRPLVRKAKREKREALGTPAGQVRYTPEAVRAVLPAVWEPVPTPIPEGEETGRRGAGDPAYGGNFQVAVMDVRMAMERLPWKTQRLLFTWFAVGVDSARAAGGITGINRKQVPTYVDNAVKALVDILNDEPWQHHDLVGSRPVLSNAQARAITDDNYGGQ